MVYVFDDLLDNFDYYYGNVKKANFKDVVSQNQKYSDISQDVLPVLIYSAMKDKGFTGTSDVLSFLRAYKDRPEYRHPMWIHSDALFADYIGIFMVQSSEFPQDDAVAIWKNKMLNNNHIYYTKDHNDPLNKKIDAQSMDPEKWEIKERIEFRQNRLVVFPAQYFHSKATLGNHGKTLDECRIVHVLFFNKEGGNGYVEGKNNPNSNLLDS